jgi:serine/threonine protein kinase
VSLKKGDVLDTAFETYTVSGHLGEGGSGVVYEIRDLDGARFAAKIIDRAKAGRIRLKRFKNEADFCSRNRHKNIIRVIGSGVTDEGASFYVMPLFPRTLRNLISGGIKPGDVLPLYGQILDGVEAAHLQGIWHRDLKPENILYAPDENTLVVADFGIAHFEEQELATAVKTKAGDRLANFLYAAPEQKDPTKTVTQKVDVYALGLILHEMFLGEVPLGTGHRKIAVSHPDFSYLDSLIERMRGQDPEKRPSISEVKQELIARNNEFIELQRLDAIKKAVVPESEIGDAIVVSPIRIVEIEDYRNERLILRLNQPVNENWVASFKNRATRYDMHAFPSRTTFQGDRVFIQVEQRATQDAVRFVKEYLEPANEDYAARVQQEHRERINRRNAERKNRIAQEEARQRTLQGLKL